MIEYAPTPVRLMTRRAQYEGRLPWPTHRLSVRLDDRWHRFRLSFWLGSTAVYVEVFA